MNVEKYKKFLDGLSTLKGTPAPLGLGGRAGPKLCLCSGGVPVLPTGVPAAPLPFLGVQHSPARCILRGL